VIVDYSKKALGDLARIASHLEKHNPGAKKRILAEIQSAIDGLEFFPELGRLVRGLQRKLTVPRTTYLVFYRIEGDEALILHVRDGRRKPYKP
jgi:plasmid stabilization system protein ParE